MFERRVGLIRRDSFARRSRNPWIPGSRFARPGMTIKRGAVVRIRAAARSTRALPLPPVAGVLREIAVLGLLADVLLLVVAMALGGVEGNAGRAAGALVALVLFGNRVEGFVHRFCHRQSPLTDEKTQHVPAAFPATQLSFRDGPKDRTSDVQLHIGNLEIPGSSLCDAPE